MDQDKVKPPPGFVLDQPTPPPGFVLDTQPTIQQTPGWQESNIPMFSPGGFAYQEKEPRTMPPYGKPFTTDLGIKIKGKTPVEHLETFLKEGQGMPMGQVGLLPTQLWSKPNFKAMVQNFWNSIKEMVLSDPKQLGALPPFRPSLGPLESIGMPKEMRKPPLEEAKQKGVIEPLQEYWGLIKFVPEILLGLYLDPGKTATEKPLETALVIGTPAIMKSVKSRMKAGKPTKMSEIKKIAKQEKIIPNEVIDAIPDEIELTAKPTPPEPSKSIIPSEAEQIAAYEKAGKVEQLEPGTAHLLGFPEEISTVTDKVTAQASKVQKRALADVMKGTAKLSKADQEAMARIRRASEDLVEVHGGYPLWDELKKSIKFILGEKPEIIEQISFIKQTKNPAKLIGAAKKDISPTIKEQPITHGTELANKLTEVLRRFAEPKRTEQEILYSQERGRRLAEFQKAGKTLRGEAGFYQRLGKLGGELEKVDFSSIRKYFKQSELDELFNTVVDSPMLDAWEVPTAGKGLAKLLGDIGGAVPTDGEIVLLNRVFGPEFTRTLMSKRPQWIKFRDEIFGVMGLPRAIMASFDLSFPLRQGLFLLPRYPKIWGKAFIEQFQHLGSEKAFQASWQKIINNPYYKLAKHGGLQLTERGGLLRMMEEPYMSQFTELIPGVKHSARAYTGFANNLRMGVFENIIKNLEQVGINPFEKKNAHYVDAAANFVNVASGRGNLKTFQKAAVILNQTFFSPRLMRSRFTLLNPKFYWKQPKIIRKHAIQSLVGFVGMGTSILATAKLAEKAFPGQVKVGGNPFSSDFGKIIIGNTRIDIWAGFQQYIRTALQVAGSKTVSPTTGKEIKLKGVFPWSEHKKTWGTPSQFDVLWRFAEYKTAPITSFFIDAYRGETSFGEPAEIPWHVILGITKPLEYLKSQPLEKTLTEDPIIKRFIPMVIQDVIDIYKEDEKWHLTISPLGFFGLGLQTYKPQPPKSQKKKTKETSFWY